MFATYLESKSLRKKASLFRDATIERLKMAWRNETNKVDCGVYTMRHMETYMGKRLKDWNPGFKSRSKNQMRFLRAKFCKAILTSEYNDHNVDIILAAQDHYKMSNEIAKVDVEKFVTNYKKVTPQ